MIFVTVGTMVPFNRIVQLMDDWSARHPETEVVAQIGTGSYEPSHMRWMRMVTNAEFIDLIAGAELIVAHAGVGSVFSALEYGKPIVIVPRYAAVKEHTTDHQVHTANWLRDRQGITVAEKNDSIDEKIEEALGKRREINGFSNVAPPEFLTRIRELVTSEGA